MKKKTRLNRKQLKLQRELLVHRSMLLREQIAHDVSRLKPRVRLLDSALDAVAWAKANPGVVAAVAGTLFVLRPKRTLGLGLKAWGLWRLGSRFLPLLRAAQTLRAK